MNIYINTRCLYWSSNKTFSPSARSVLNKLLMDERNITNNFNHKWITTTSSKISFSFLSSFSQRRPSPSCSYYSFIVFRSYTLHTLYSKFGVHTRSVWYLHNEVQNLGLWLFSTCLAVRICALGTNKHLKTKTYQKYSFFFFLLLLDTSPNDELS